MYLRTFKKWRFNSRSDSAIKSWLFEPWRIKTELGKFTCITSWARAILDKSDIKRLNWWSLRLHLQAYLRQSCDAWNLGWQKHRLISIHNIFKRIRLQWLLQEISCKESRQRVEFVSWVMEQTSWEYLIHKLRHWGAVANLKI